jgi:hypothetical protein
MDLPGPGIANRSTAALAHFKSGRKAAPLGPESSRILESTKDLLDRAAEKTGPKPLALLLTSHPETTGPESRLLGDLVHHAIKIGEFLFPRSKFKLVQATDDFALDTLPLPMKGIYAGLILSGQIAVERMPGSKTALQEWIFGKARYPRAIFEILKGLRAGNVVCAALGGGVSHNSRLIYVIREFAHRIFALSEKRGKSKRQFRWEILSILTEQEPCVCRSGTLSAKEKENLVRFMKSSEISEEGIAGELKELEKELELKAPYRQRLFRILFHRICGRGLPLAIIPLNHSARGEVFLNPPVLVKKYDCKKGKVSAVAVNGSQTEQESDAEAFVKKFVGESYGQR